MSSTTVQLAVCHIKEVPILLLENRESSGPKLSLLLAQYYKKWCNGIYSSLIYTASTSITVFLFGSLTSTDD
jgi:hypothetical protein